MTDSEYAFRLIEELGLAQCIGPDAHERGEKCWGCEIYTVAHGQSDCHDGCPVKKEGVEMVEKFKCECS